MKQILMLAASLMLLFSCGQPKGKTAAVADDPQLRENRVEVLVFYGARRCATCHAIEDVSKVFIEENFSAELADGRLVYRTIDISLPENAAIAEKYQVASSSLIVTHWLGEEEQVQDLTRMAFSTARVAPDQFKAGLQEVIQPLLDTTPSEPCCEIPEV
jgi:hypothetical protein